MRFNSLSATIAGGRGWPPNQRDRHLRPSVLPGKPSCDSATIKLRIVNPVAQKEGIGNEEAKRRSTSIIPMGRYGTPAEFGALAAFVAGVPASYITGSMLRCDGGNIRSI